MLPSSLYNVNTLNCFTLYGIFIPLTLVFLELILLVIASFAAGNFALLPSFFTPFLSPPLFISLSLSSPWARAMKCSKQKRFCILRFCLSAREWLLHLCPLPHRSDSITGIWVNALYALRCRSKGPQRAGLRPQNWRKQRRRLALTYECAGESPPLWPS